MAPHELQHPRPCGERAARGASLCLLFPQAAMVAVCCSLWRDELLADGGARDGLAVEIGRCGWRSCVHSVLIRVCMCARVLTFAVGGRSWRVRLHSVLSIL